MTQPENTTPVDTTGRSVALTGGGSIPSVGLGTYTLRGDECVRAVRAAIDAGYRLIDTATIYKNEAEVGQAIREAIAAGDISRDDITVTTKLWNNRHGAEWAAKALEFSESQLDLDYIDVYLIHWPCTDRGLYVETYEQMAKAQKDGRVKHIGVSNFWADPIDDLIDATGVVPVINQIENHPGFYQDELILKMHDRGVIPQAWSPIGRGKFLDHPSVQTVAEQTGRTPAQVVLRWQLQHGAIVVPRSKTPKRIAENINLYDFELNEQQMALIDALRTAEGAGRRGPDPAEYGNDVTSGDD